MPTPTLDLSPHLAGRAALVTGASRTLGAEIARALARHGVRVAVNYHQSPAAAQRLCAEIEAVGGQAIPLGADVSQAAAVETLIDQAWASLGPLDILVNNVGPYVDTPFLDLSLADFDRIMAGNVRATFIVSQLAGRRMQARGQGQMVNIAATDIFHRSHSVYGLAKQGLIYLTEALALELAPQVRVNALAPDLIADNEGMDPDFARRAAAGTPLGRLVTRAEVAEAVCLLCTPLFAIVTGQTLVMDGGRTIPRINMGASNRKEKADGS